jgi:hypothetical protein
MKTYKGLTLSRYNADGMTSDVPSGSSNKYVGQQRGQNGSGNAGRGSQGVREDTAYYSQSLSERKSQYQKEKEAGATSQSFTDWDNTN